MTWHSGRWAGSQDPSGADYTRFLTSPRATTTLKPGWSIQQTWWQSRFEENYVFARGEVTWGTRGMPSKLCERLRHPSPLRRRPKFFPTWCQ